MNVFVFFMVLVSLTYGQTQVYMGEASKDGKLVYREKHTVEFEGAEVKSSVTEYTAPDGKLIARLSNTYLKSLNAPENTMDDLRGKNKHGVRYTADQLVLFNQDEGAKEETKTLDPEDAKGKLIVGGQGFHYYLVKNLEDVIRKGKLDLKFLIPGRLDAYDFYLKVVKKDEQTVTFEIEIDNWFLRLFAPKLKLVYQRKTPRLLRYSGLSNIRDEKKDMMNVDISYKYND